MLCHAPVQSAACTRMCRQRKSLACFASTKDSRTAPSVATVVQRCTSGVLSAALAASLVVSGTSLASPPAASAAPSAETSSFGAERTKKLVDQATPGAAKPDTMKTNVPFQAPGVNAPPRGKGQEEGTNVRRVLKDAGKQIKENSADPDSAPFGISRGPLVREAKKASQPGSVTRFKRGSDQSFRAQYPETRAAKAIEANPNRPNLPGWINGGFTRGWGSPK